MLPSYNFSDKLFGKYLDFGDQRQISLFGANAMATAHTQDRGSKPTEVEKKYDVVIQARRALDTAQSAVRLLRHSGLYHEARTQQATRVEAALSRLESCERDLIATPSATLRDLACKILVAAENEFDSDELNELLEVEARQLCGD